MTPLAERRIRSILKRVQGFSSLARKGSSSQPWVVSVQVIGAAEMTRLNSRFRGKAYSTDVLSFNAPEVFVQKGHLGELVICLPVLRRQAKEFGHSEAKELDVLLVHGILHLLGMDHEAGEKEARRMARWESKLLDAMHLKKGNGLIGRLVLNPKSG